MINCRRERNPEERMFCASVSRVLCSLPPYFFMKCRFLSCSSALAILQKDRNTRNHPVLLPFPQPNRTNWRGRGNVILLYGASSGWDYVVREATKISPFLFNSCCQPAFFRTTGRAEGVKGSWLRHCFYFCGSPEDMLCPGVRSTENEGQVEEVKVACKWTCLFVLFVLQMSYCNYIMYLCCPFSQNVCVLFTTTASVFLFSTLFRLLDVNLLDRRSSITMWRSGCSLTVATKMYTDCPTRERETDICWFSNMHWCISSCHRKAFPPGNDKNEIKGGGVDAFFLLNSCAVVCII